MTELVRTYKLTDSGAWGWVTEEAEGGGGGGSQFIGSEQGSGNNVSIADNTQAPLTWNTTFGPDTLLDLVTPGTPSVVEAGIYAVSAALQPMDAMTVGGTYTGILDLDFDGEDPEVFQDSSPASASVTLPQLTLSMTWYIPAGGTIQVAARNLDGAQAINFRIRAWTVARISGPRT